MTVPLQFNNQRRLAKELKQHYIHIRVPSATAYFADLTDLHVGHKGFDEEALTNFVNVVRQTENFFVAIGGDASNHANKGSKSSQFEEYMTPREQLKGKVENGRVARKGLVQLLDPIRDRIVAVIDGNHNGTRLQEFNDMSAAEYLCDLLQLPYFGELVNIEFVVGENSYTHFIHHNGSTGKTKNVGKLMDRSVYFEADVHWGEHTHQDQYARIPVISYDRKLKSPTVRDRLYINGNSYLSWSGYAKAKLYSPNTTGAHIVEMNGKQRHWDLRVWERVQDFYQFTSPQLNK